MIPLDFITEWRAQAPWVQDHQVEQDLILTRALVELFTREEIASQLAFRGGTALYKLHLVPALRYSEDLDFVQTTGGPIGGILTAVRAALDPWLGTPKYTLKESRVTLVYRLTGTGAAPLPMRLKVEINSREHFSVYGYQHRSLRMESRWFTAAADIQTYAIDELLGTKLRALYQRKKGRDLFDLWIASVRAPIDAGRIVECCSRYLDHGGAHLTRAQLESNLHEKLADPDFAADVEPLIAPGVPWDIDAAANFVRQELAPCLPGEAWKGPT